MTDDEGYPKLVHLYQGNFRDIPGTLRTLADQIETNEEEGFGNGQVTRVVVVADAIGGIDVLSMGDINNDGDAHLMLHKGMLLLAKGDGLDV